MGEQGSGIGCGKLPNTKERETVEQEKGEYDLELLLPTTASPSGDGGDGDAADGRLGAELGAADGRLGCVLGRPRRGERAVGGEDKRTLVGS